MLPKYTEGVNLTWSPGADAREVRVHAVLRIMLRALSCLHGFWRQKTYLTDREVDDYQRNIDLFAKCWHAFQWKPAVWVHWMVAHSGYYIKMYRTLYLFSSIPSEHRHQTFKLDLRHSFQGWKLQNPRCNERGLQHVVELDSLDQGLHLLQLSKDLEASKKRKRL